MPDDSSENQKSRIESGPTVIGIGASAGGLSALKTLLNHVPPDSGLAFVVVVHLSPDHESHLAKLLQPHVRFPVRQVNETTAIEPNHVYVIPPNANLSAIDTHLRLSALEERRQERAPIDHFFRTLANTHDGRAVAVILTGTGSDGTLGVKDIKANGGLVIVQDPNDAEYDGMPQSAIATGMVDLILPLSEIPVSVLRFDRTKPRVPLPRDDADDVPQSERMLLQKIFAQLRAHTDRDFSRYKRSSILRRIARRMQLNYVEDLDKYLDRLRQTPEEVRALADDLLLTVTHFFRDPEVFAKLAKDEVPRMFSAASKDSIRAWSVGCATGEEAYSIAMLLEEEASKHDSPPHLQVFASDLHSRSLEKAREGFYPGDIEADVSAERLKRFFTKENGGYRIRREIRDMVVFAPHNILADPPFSRLDLISCRNLLIYLERDVQRDVIELFHYALNPEGTLMLGSAETIDAADLFRVEDKKLCFFRKRNVPPREPRLPVFPLIRSRVHGDGPAASMPSAAPVAYGHLHHQMVEQYAPPSILVSPDNRLVHLSEHAGRYLMHPGGAPTETALKLVREELRVELQAILRTAREKKQAIDSNPIPVRFNGHPRPVVLHVRPALEPERDGFALIIFEEREPKTAAEKEVQGTATHGSARERIQELENELNISRQRLQDIIEEYETSQEEMKASTEEMQSTNEELRSTMEELETSKEELQSINEELQTVNEQNRHKVEELAQVLSDLQNFLAATDIATVFLDRELRIVRFTPKLGDLFNVLSTDRGRPISDLTHRLGYADLRNDAEAVLSRLVPIEREVQDDRGRWYLTRVLPYRSSDDRIEGIVITFVDIDTRKRAEERLRANAEYLRRMVNVDVVGVLTFDQTGTLIDSNDTFLRMSGYTREEIAARKLTWRSMTPPEYLSTSEEQLRKLSQTGHIGPYEKEYISKDGSRSWMLFVGSSLGDGTIVEYCIDVSDRRRAEKGLKESERDLLVSDTALVRANADLKHFSYAVSHDMQEPLRMVTIYTQLLERDYKDKLDAQARQFIGYAVEGASRMEALLTDLREYWSVDEQRVEKLVPVDCDSVLEKTVGFLETSIRGSGATVSHGTLPTVMAEEYPLSLLFQNLLSNAIKYHRPDQAPKIHVLAEQSNGTWTFSIQDNGLGVADEHREAIFTPFKRLHGGAYPGTGLGLAMCKRIVERYQGQIWVESNNGRGSVFKFTLPIADGRRNYGAGSNRPD